MSLQEQMDRFAALDAWLHTPHGAYVARAIDEELLPLHELLRGETLVQLGGSLDNLWLSRLQFRYKWLLGVELAPKNMHCSCLMDALPLEAESIDCVILPFTLDAFAHKAFFIDEIDRVLTPRGVVVFLGVNSLSLWGLWLRYSSQSFFGRLHGFPKSILPIQRSLLHRGYLQCYYNGFYFIPPVKQKKWFNRFVFLNQVGKMISLSPSGFYCLVMQKQVKNYIEPLRVGSQKDLLKDLPAYQPVC